MHTPPLAMEADSGAGPDAHIAPPASKTQQLRLFGGIFKRAFEDTQYVNYHGPVANYHGVGILVRSPFEDAP